MSRWTIPGTDIRVRLNVDVERPYLITSDKLYMTKPELLTCNCPHCKMETMSKAEVYLLQPDGVSLLGSVIRCSMCEGALL